MNVLRHFSRFLLFCTVGLFVSSASGAEPTLPTERDRQVFDGLFSDLLSDNKFNMTRVVTDQPTILLHVRTPNKIGPLSAHQMRSDVGDRKVPADAEGDMRQRNTPAGARPDAFDAVDASYDNLKFAAGIVVADLAAVWKQGPLIVPIEAHPHARGWFHAFLPGYSRDGAHAVVRAGVGPWVHGAMLTAVLEKSGDKWVVKWYHISRYA